MSKYEVDYSHIERMFDKNRMPVQGNEHKMVRVAFDFFRVDGDNTDSLWSVQADDDGNEYLVRTFLDQEDEKIAESSWSVVPDKKYANLTVSYDNLPIKRIRTADFGINTTEDAQIFRKTLLRKLALDNVFSTQFVSELPPTKQEMVKNAGFRGLSKEEQWKLAFKKLNK